MRSDDAAVIIPRTAFRSASFRIRDDFQPPKAMTLLLNYFVQIANGGMQFVRSAAHEQCHCLLQSLH
jgi:hypothetical protein